MELQWPLIIFTTLVAWSAGLFGVILKNISLAFFWKK